MASEAAKHINPEPAQWVGLVYKALAKWRGRVSEVCLEELHQVGLTRLYLESEKWNGEGSWSQYAVARIQWSMLDWLRIEGAFPSRKGGKDLRSEFGRHETWRDHPEMPPYIPTTPGFLRFGHRISKAPVADLADNPWEDSDPLGEVMPEDLIAATVATPEDDLDVAEDSRMLVGLIKGLNSPNAQRVMRLRLEGYSLRMIARDMGVSTSRVEQISKEAVATMQRMARRQGLERNGRR